MRLADLRLTDEGRAVIARLTGELDLSNTANIGGALTEGVPNTARALILDLTDIDYLDSAGIHLIFELREKLRARGQTLQLVIPRFAGERRTPARRGLRPCRDRRHAGALALAAVGSSRPAGGRDLADVRGQHRQDAAADVQRPGADEGPAHGRRRHRPKPYSARIRSGSSAIVMKLTVSRTGRASGGTGGSSTISRRPAPRPRADVELVALQHVAPVGLEVVESRGHRRRREAEQPADDLVVLPQRRRSSRSRRPTYVR